MKTKDTGISRRALALAAALALLLGLLSSCADKLEAATMHLRQARGTVRVSSDAGKDLEPVSGLGLYSGYGVNTRGGSYAWIDLDEVKLTKMDQDSAIEIQKKDKHLTIEVKYGSLFFNITEPLADDETLDIRTSNMVVGIRGTCGWIEVPEDDCMDVYLLSGKVEVTAGESTATVTAGEMARMQGETPIEVREFTADEVKPFVEEEADSTLLEALPGSGEDSGGIEETLPPFIGQDEPVPTEDEPVMPGENHLDITGTAGDLTVDGESVTIHGDASVGRIVINSGSVEIYGSASTGEIILNQGTLDIYEGAMVQGIVVNGGSLSMSDYAMTFSLTVEDGYVQLNDHAEIVMFFRPNGGTIDDNRQR